jgi:hypothetical protein
VILSFILILVFGALYAVMSFHGWTVPSQLEVAPGKSLAKWVDPLFNSLVSFLPTGAPYGDLKGLDILAYKSSIPRLVMVLENIVGLFLIFLFTLTFFRKTTRD